ncbi:MAG: hypothetical protein ABIH37_05660 [archaeon]
MKCKKGMMVDYLGWIIIAVIVLILVLVAYFLLAGKQIEAFDFIKKALRFGR